MRKSLAFILFVAAAATLAPRPAMAGTVSWVSLVASTEVKLLMAIFGAICLVVAALTIRHSDAYASDA